MNLPRYSKTPGHVESWFFRANHPSRPLAVWIKLTILAPLQGPAVVETWFIGFDGVKNRSYAHRDTHPFEQAELGGSLKVGSCHIDFAAAKLWGRVGPYSFNLNFVADPAPFGAPLRIFPYAWMVTAPFPKSKLLTPFPSARFSGTVQMPEGDFEVDGWPGMQGHNWGKEHAFEYAWGQCLFLDGEPTMVEGFTGRIRLGGYTTPRLSAMVVRRGSREYRFDRLFDPWRQEATLTEERWTLRLRGPDGEARLRMSANGRPIACLGYANPDGRISYCFNSKLADVLLEVTPRHDAPFHCSSAHGGALEFLRQQPDPSLPVV